jgi:hypothetical protein
MNNTMKNYLKEFSIGTENYLSLCQSIAIVFHRLINKTYK